MTDLARITELGYIGLSIVDTATWGSFATEVLGMELVLEGETDRFYLRLDAQHHRITVDRGATDDLAFVGWRVPHADALERVAAQVEETGLAVVGATSEELVERRVLGMFKVVSPGGIPTEVFFGPQVDHHKPFHPGRPMYERFATDGGMGHVVLREEDVDAAARFYREGLGMVGGVEYVYGGASRTVQPQFFHTANTRQHSVAFGIPRLERRLHHFMVECTNVDDVGQAHDEVQRRGLTLTLPLGKHANDQMLSFYVRTPAGFEVEYGAGGRRPIEEAEFSVEDMWGRHLAAPRRARPDGGATT